MARPSSAASTAATAAAIAASTGASSAAAAVSPVEFWGQPLGRLVAPAAPIVARMPTHLPSAPIASPVPSVAAASGASPPAALPVAARSAEARRDVVLRLASLTASLHLVMTACTHTSLSGRLTENQGRALTLAEQSCLDALDALTRVPRWDGGSAAAIPHAVNFASGDEEAAIAVLRHIVAALAPGVFEARGADDIIVAADAAARCAAGLLRAPQPAADVRPSPAAAPPLASSLSCALAPATATDPQRAALRLLARLTALHLVVIVYAAAHFTAAMLTDAQAVALSEAEQLMLAAIGALLAVPGWDGSAAAPIRSDEAGMIPGTQPVVALLRRIFAAVAPQEPLSAVDTLVAAAAAALAANRVAECVEAAVAQPEPSVVVLSGVSTPAALPVAAQLSGPRRACTIAATAPSPSIPTRKWYILTPNPAQPLPTAIRRLAVIGHRVGPTPTASALEPGTIVALLGDPIAPAQCRLSADALRLLPNSAVGRLAAAEQRLLAGGLPAEWQVQPLLSVDGCLLRRLGHGGSGPLGWGPPPSAPGPWFAPLPCLGPLDEALLAAVLAARS